MKVGLPGP